MNSAWKVAGNYFRDSACPGAVPSLCPCVITRIPISRKGLGPLRAARQLLALLVGVGALAGCGGARGGVTSAGSADVEISVSPAVASLPPGGTQQFQATVGGVSTERVTWTVGF